MVSQDFYQTREYLFTSESVSEGHPDKVCDQISDAVLDTYLAKDAYARVACETLATTNRVVIAGEVRCKEEITSERVREVVCDVIKNIGYEQEGFDWRTVNIDVLLHRQSPDIAQGVDAQGGKTEGAGDQGLMFGYACDETEALMPAPIYYSHKILEKLSAGRHNGTLKGILPDAKSQVTLVYKGNTPVRAHSVVVSTQHEESMSQSQVREMVRGVVESVLPKGWMPEEKEFYTNPTGRFVIGGPDGDAGLTGRKIIVDTYGGSAPHGGGAFSGKDPTKVDRSAAYAARYLAKNIVGAKLAKACTIQIAYAIGVAKPLSLYVNTHGTGVVNEYEIVERIHKVMDLTPWGIRNHLQLNKPIYLPTAAYGHFGRTPTKEGHFSWEKLDLVDKLK